MHGLVWLSGAASPAAALFLLPRGKGFCPGAELLWQQQHIQYLRQVLRGPAELPSRSTSAGGKGPVLKRKETIQIHANQLAGSPQSAPATSVLGHEAGEVPRGAMSPRISQ